MTTTLLLVRHGIAEDPAIAAASNLSDEMRALTPEGVRKMERIATALAKMVPEIALVAASPLRRAVETAQILAHTYASVPLTKTPALQPGAPLEAIPIFLRDRHLGGTAALVGHEPDLGRWASWALAGASRSFMPFKKGGAALLSFSGLPGAGQGELLWLATPNQLRDLA